MTHTNPFDSIASALDDPAQLEALHNTPVMEGAFDFSVFEEGAWSPYANWDSDPLSRQEFAQALYNLAHPAGNASPSHEMRAAMLMRFSRALLNLSLIHI